MDGSDEKIKIYDLSAIKVRSLVACDAKKISIESLFYEFPLPSSCEDMVLKLNLTAMYSSRASRTIKK